MMKRRLLLSGSVAAAGLLATHAAFAATANVTWTCAYTGADFSTPATLFAGIGSTLTVSSTGKVTGVSGSGTSITLSTTEGATNFTGHPLTIGGVTNMITSYNTSTQVATITATSAYPTGTFGSAPSVGTAYTIADVNVTLQIGQSSVSSNAWSLGSVLTLGAITTSSTDAIMITSATAWNFSNPLAANSTGALTQAVLLTCAGYHAYTLTVSSTFVTLSGLCIENSSSGSGITATGNFSFINSMVNLSNGGNSGMPGLFVTNNFTIKNSVFANSAQVSVGIYTITSGGVNVVRGCTFVNISIARNYGGAFNPVEACAFLNPSGLGTTNITYTGCVSDYTGSLPTGVTLIASGNAIVQQLNVSFDGRPVSAGTLINASPADSTNLPTDLYGVSRPSSGTITAGAVQTGFTPPATITVPYTFAYNGDATISLTAPTALAALCGPNLIYFSSGRTCSGTAADSTHIVVATAETAASIVGHPISWKGGPPCVALSHSGSTIAVGALVGYGAASFTGTPQSGDAYTVNPVFAQIIIGPPASGAHTEYVISLTTGGANTAALTFNATTSATCRYEIKGSAPLHSGAAGSGTDGTGFIWLNVTGDHAAVFGLNSDHNRIHNLQIQCSGSQGPPAGDGVLISSINFTDSQWDHNVLRGDNYSNDTAHALIDSESGTCGGIAHVAEVIVGTSAYHQKMLASGTALNCTLIETQLVTLTANGASAAGQKIITTTNTTGAFVGSSNLNPWVGHPNVPDGSIITAVTSGISITINNNITGGGIANGDTVYIGAWSESLDPITLTNCLVLGLVSHPNATASNCKTDINPHSIAGFTTIAGASQITTGYAGGSGTGVSVDARPAPGNSLTTGGSGATGNDIYGQAFTAAMVGAIQYPPLSSGGTANFFHVSP